MYDIICKTDESEACETLESREEGASRQRLQSVKHSLLLMRSRGALKRRLMLHNTRSSPHQARSIRRSVGICGLPLKGIAVVDSPDATRIDFISALDYCELHHDQKLRYVEI